MLGARGFWGRRRYLRRILVGLGIDGGMTVAETVHGGADAGWGSRASNTGLPAGRVPRLPTPKVHIPIVDAYFLFILWQK